MLDLDAFRRFECINILLDLQIDEEEYRPDRQCCTLRLPDGWSVLGRAGQPCLVEDGPRPVLRVDALPDNMSVDVQLDSSVRPVWLPPGLKSSERFDALHGSLLIAKAVRSEMQSFGGREHLDLLDELGLWLLGSLPPFNPAEWADLCSGGEPPREWGEAQARLLLRFMFLNEIAACHHGALSAGYAEQCLGLIRKTLRRGRTVHELVALYNQAQAELHQRNHNQALDDFSQVESALDVDSPAEDDDTSEYFGDAWWQLDSGSRDLTEQYLLYQARLMEADVLINLQRTVEASTLLKGDFAAASDYKRARRTALRGRATTDMGREIDKEDELLEALREAERLGKAGLASQQRAVLLQQRRLLAEECPEGPQLREQIDGIKALLLEQIEGSATDKSERDQALLEWAKTLKLAANLLQKSLHGSGSINTAVLANEVLQLLDLKSKDEKALADSCVDVAKDAKFRDHKPETRQVLLRVLEGLSEAEGDETADLSGLADRARALLRRLLEGLCTGTVRTQLTEYEKAKYDEQLKALAPGGGEEEEVPEARDDLKALREFMAREFFGPGSKNADECCENTRGAFECVSCNPQNKESAMSFGRRIDGNAECWTCAPSVTSDGWMVEHRYDTTLRESRKRLDQRLYARSDDWLPPSGWAFVVLQRWNSYTPALGASEGGGYFLFHADNSGEIDLGLVVDPGYDFIKNYLDNGFGVSDISAIIISHQHPDHEADFEALVNLLVEAKKGRGGQREYKPVLLGLSEGAFEHLLPIIDSAREVFEDVQVLVPESYRPRRKHRLGTLRIPRRGADASAPEDLKVIATKALHDLKDGSDAIGFKIEISGQGGTAVIGITCDTKWEPSLREDYADCDLTCVHLGSLLPDWDLQEKRFRMSDYFRAGRVANEVLREKGQLYLPGALWLTLGNTAPGAGQEQKLVILSEFGEELQDRLRTDFAERLSEFSVSKQGPRVIPGDIGLVVDPVSRLIKCSRCGKYYPWTSDTTLKTSGTGEREAIAYGCPVCSGKDAHAAGSMSPTVPDREGE